MGSKGGRCVRLTTLAPSRDYCLEILAASTSWSPRDCTGIDLPSTLDTQFKIILKVQNLCKIMPAFQI
jgi:hypothetical protein